MHANSDEAQQFGLDAGVDIMAHGMWNLYQEHSTTSEVTPGMKKILDQELARNVGYQPTMQVLYGLRDVVGEIISGDPQLRRVLPAALIDWYRSAEGQWFHAGVTGYEVARQSEPESTRAGRERSVWRVKWHMCRQMRDHDIPGQPDSGFEPRIKVFVIADPVSFFPDKTSLQKVTAPIQLWSSERGGMGVRPEDVMSLKKNLPDSPEFHRPANSAHLDFLFPCSDVEAKAMSFQCIDDPPGFNRADFHREFNVQVLEFFRKHLPSHDR